MRPTHARALVRALPLPLLTPAAAGTGTLVISHVGSGAHIATIRGESEAGVAGLTDVTAVGWNEERGEVVTGTARGTIAVWA